MGETISYSSGKVPEPGLDVDLLVEGAREVNRRAVYHAEYGLSIFEGFDQWRDFYAKHANDLCDALEEKEEEVSSLRVALTLRDGDVEDLEREVERLREEVKNVTSMIVAIGGTGALQAAREREEERD